MKNILKDIVEHTHSLGFLDLIKITTDDESTKISSIAEDKSVIMFAQAHRVIPDFNGTFGMTNLSKLALHLKNPEYSSGEKIQIVTSTNKDGEEYPSHIHFENSSGDFKNDYRFMNKKIIEEKLKNVTFNGATWNIEITPSIAAIQRLKLMSAAHTEELLFDVKTQTVDDVTNLIFLFGDASTHSGEFIFEPNVTGKLSHTWSWPIAQVYSILTLPGDAKMSISNQGAMKISVDSGFANYEYILPAQIK